jgi:hypothetical protein
LFEPSSRLICYTCAVLFLRGIPGSSYVVSHVPQEQSQVPEGIVIGLTQDLTVGQPQDFPNQLRRLSLGNRVRAGEVVRDSSGGPAVSRDSLTVWFEGHKPSVYPCTIGKPNECHDSRQIYLPMSNIPPQKRLTEKAGDTIMKLVAVVFPEEPSRYFSAASRGLEGEVKEAVVPLQGSHVDVAAALFDLSAGAYSVRFEALAPSTGKATTLQVRWQSGQQALVPAAGLRPGLYRLTLLEGTDEPGGSEAWVLLSGPQRYSTDSAAFQGVQDTVAAWPKSADPVAIRAVLRASLEALSKQEKDQSCP